MKNNFVPILFSTPMVQAILENRKTQTRRIIKPQPDFDSAWKNLSDHGGRVAAVFLNETRPATEIPDLNLDGYLLGVKSENGFGTGICIPNVKIPYHKGDILWVRETWSLFGWCFDDGEVRLKFKDGTVKTFDDLPDDIYEWLARKIDKLEDRGILQMDPEDEERMELAPGKQFPWEPSIFMPKWACRIFLEVTDVRVERLQDISAMDSVAEGIERMPAQSWWRNYLNDPLPGCSMARESFSSLWRLINGPDSWTANPWVWVYEFKRIEKPVNFL